MQLNTLPQKKTFSPRHEWISCAPELKEWNLSIIYPINHLQGLCRMWIVKVPSLFFLTFFLLTFLDIDMKLWYLTKDYLFLAEEQLQNVIVLIVFMHLICDLSCGPNLKPLETNLKAKTNNIHKTENATAVLEMAKVWKSSDFAQFSLSFMFFSQICLIR